MTLIALVYDPGNGLEWWEQEDCEPAYQVPATQEAFQELIESSPATPGRLAEFGMDNQPGLLALKDVTPHFVLPAPLLY